jgi:hypothetical protein
LALDGGEAELVEVEGAGGGGVLHGEGDDGHLVADAVGAEVLAEVLGVERAGHVLGVLDVLRVGELLRALHGEEQVAGGGGADGDGGEALGDVEVVEALRSAPSKQRCRKPTWRRGGDGVELDELAVVDLEEGLW